MERKVTTATEEEINAIKGIHRFDTAPQEQAEAIRIVNSNFGIPDPTQQLAATSGEVQEPAPVSVASPVQTQPPVEPAVEPDKVAEPVIEYKFTKEYIAEAKVALAALKVDLGEAKFAELEESIKKGLDSPFFIKNAKGGYTPQENIADIALKAQGFTNVPTKEDKAAKVSAVRDIAKIAPSPVVDVVAPKGKSQKDYLKELKYGNPNGKKAAIHALVGVDETMALINGYMKKA